MKKISNSIIQNEKNINELLHYPLSNDVKIRKFKIHIDEKDYDSLLVFYDGLVDADLINNFILRQLMKGYETKEKKKTVIKSKDMIDIRSIIADSMISESQIDFSGDFDNIVSKVLHGDAALFVDTLDVAILCDVKKPPSRAVSRAENEMNIKGPAEAFIESFRTNTALIRKYVKDENLIFESVEIGLESKTRCSICYVNTIANNSLVSEVKKRVSSIKIDYLLDSGQLEQLIEDKTYLVDPLILSTERPDKVASHLVEGRVGILVEGSNNVLIVPAIFSDFVNPSEDSYIRYPYTTLLKLLRIPAIILAVFLPGLYIAICNFHQEMVPTDLLFAIARYS